VSLELIQIQGVGKITAERLTVTGLGTVQAVAEAKVEAIASASGFPTARAAAIHQSATRLLGAKSPAPAVSTKRKKDNNMGKKKKDEKDEKKKDEKKKDKGRKGKNKDKGKKKKDSKKSKKKKK